MSGDSILSVDVEDWFHVLEAGPAVATWGTLPSHVERNFHRLLEIFGERGVHATCFFLGWVAERFPHLIREAKERGHEIASHGYSHTLTYQLTPAAFLEDIRKAKDILEGIAGAPVRGYRAPGFSVTRETPWFFEKLAEAGLTYDSSVFPASRQHGGLLGGPLEPYVVETSHGPVQEFPITVARVLGKPVCFFGGGYLRLFPYRLVKAMSRRVHGEGRPVVFYVHPREIQPDHPRIPMKPVKRFKSYVGLRTMEPKLKRLISDFPVTTFEAYMKQRALAATPAVGRGAAAANVGAT